MQAWEVDGHPRAAVIALFPISAGTEITYNYGWTVDENTPRTKCLCGTIPDPHFIETYASTAQE